VLERDKIVESGTFHDLLKREGVLTKMKKHYQVGSGGEAGVDISIGNDITVRIAN
jgi:hypothetical protein